MFPAAYFTDVYYAEVYWPPVLGAAPALTWVIWISGE
jgi:hypothetical protein